MFKRKLFRVLAGNTLMGLGISLVITAGIGVDPWTVLSLGVSNVLQISVGRAAQLQGLLFMSGVYLIYRRKPGLGTLINMMLVGLIIDFSQGLVTTPQLFLGQLGVLAMGLLILSFGVALYVAGNLGEGPIEQLMLALHFRHGWPIGRIRIVMDFVATSSGFLLGGSVGLGTLISVVVIGPTVAKFLQLIPDFAVTNSVEFKSS